MGSHACSYECLVTRVKYLASILGVVKIAQESKLSLRIYGPVIFVVASYNLLETSTLTFYFMKYVLSTISTLYYFVLLLARVFTNVMRLNVNL